MVTTLVGVWYAAIFIGVPLPTLRQVFSERFPCENCHCGCDSAERCWGNCCCHTVAERLEWAKREGVTPPSFVMKELASSKPLPPCCAKRVAEQQEKKACCKSGSDSCCSGQSEPSSGSSYVLGWKALKCQGVGVEWTAAVPAVPLGPWQMPELPVCVEWLASIQRPSLPSVYDAPSVPPPEYQVA